MQHQQQTVHDYISARLFEISDRAAKLGQKDGSSYLTRETQHLYRETTDENKSSWWWNKSATTRTHDAVEIESYNLTKQSEGRSNAMQPNIPFIANTGKENIQ